MVSSTVNLLYQIIYDAPYNSCKKLKLFSGFPVDFDSNKHKETVLTELNKTELKTICNSLGLDCSGTASKLKGKIFSNLTDLAFILEMHSFP